MADSVTCVPCGERISLRDAYYCSTCDAYFCWRHLLKALLSTAIRCPKGHRVIRAR
jgi:hypothetical protein